MAERFQFSTLMKKFIEHKVGTFSQEDLLLSIFDSVFNSMAESGYKVPEQSTLSRWITGERGIPAKIVERCKYPDAEKLIEKDIRKNVLKHITDVDLLIYKIIGLVREDASFQTENRKKLINFEPKLEKTYSGYLALAVVSVVKRKSLRNSNKTDSVAMGPSVTEYYYPIGRSVPLARPFFTGWEKEIKEIEEALIQNKVVFLYGQRGIGKSALAAELANHNQVFSSEIWLTYEGSLQQTIESFSLSGQNKDNVTESFQRKMQWFKSQGRDPCGFG